LDIYANDVTSPSKRRPRLERERLHQLLLEDARRGFADVTAGRVHDADAAIASLQERRNVAAKASRQRD
jgi:hypothetical protein